MSNSASENLVPHRVLTSDLARLSLPQTFDDSARRLAYANSIGLLFLIIGLIGINPPNFARPEIPTGGDTVPVIFAPPAEQPANEPQKSDSTKPSDAPSETPEVAAIVVPNSADVAFAVPVEGPVVVAGSARFAQPPQASRPSRPAASGPAAFIPGGSVAGAFPWPTARDYPKEALSQHAQGTVLVYVMVDAAGSPVRVEVKDTSGYYMLDQAAVRWIKNKWRWLPGETREYYCPFEWQLR